jgi:hypothetical protein
MKNYPRKPLFINLTDTQHANACNRVKKFKYDFNPDISNKQLRYLIDKGLYEIEKANRNQDISIKTPLDVLSIAWGLEYFNALQGQLSATSFMKIVDNGKIYKALKKYNESHDNKIDIPMGNLRSYSYRRISSHSSEYSGEDMVKSINPLSKTKIPLQFGIDIRMVNKGPMLPGGKNTILFHKENDRFNKGKKILGIKFEQAGFPSFNRKAWKHTLSEAFDHVDQYLTTREQHSVIFLASIFDVIKASLNLLISSLNIVSFGKLRIPVFNIGAFDKQNHKEFNKNQLLTSVIEFFLASFATISFGRRPFGIKTHTKTSFREHIKDIKWNDIKLGSEIKKFAQKFSFNETIKEAISHNRVGEIIDALSDFKKEMTPMEQRKFENLKENYEDWIKNKNHSTKTSHIRSGAERILDITGDLEMVSYHEKNVGDSLTNLDRNLSRGDISKKKIIPILETSHTKHSDKIAQSKDSSYIKER